MSSVSQQPLLIYQDFRMKLFYLFTLGFVSLALTLCGHNSASAQTNYAREGMTSGQANYTSFAVPATQQNTNFWKQYHEEAFYSHPEFATLPENSPCNDCVELLDRRKIDERYFVDKVDTAIFYIQKANGELHYEQNGQLLTINSKLVPEAPGVYRSNFPHNPVVLETNLGRSQMETEHGALSFNSWSLYTESVDGEVALADNANWSDFTAGDDGVYVRNIFSGIDAELRVLRGTIKTNFIIRENNYGSFKNLLFRDQLDTDGTSVDLQFTENIQGQRGVGEVSASTNGYELALISSAYAYPVSEERVEQVFLEYTLGQSALSLAVPFELIDQYDGVQHLIIDPLVTGTNTLAQAAINGSMYNFSCNFDTSCDYNLTVAAPPNATFTDVLWSFDYLAQGLCWMSDGALRIRTGGCLSPGDVGYYWFCNLTSSGDCTGDNISIIDDLGGCLPPPSCAPQNVTFTMEFFRSCWGAFGCSNACVGAMSPWTMTIQGYTVEPSNITNPITGNTTVCEGGSLNFSTLGNYGVPPYSYQWSFSPTGSPVLATGSNVSITFPTSGPITLYSTIIDDCGNEVTNSITVNVTPGITPVITGDLTYCEGETAQLSTTTPYNVYNWSTGANSATINATENDNPITVTVTDVNGCIGTSEEFTVTELPSVFHTDSITVCQGESAIIHGNSETVAGDYAQSFATAEGCDSTATITLLLNPLPDIVASATNLIICDGQETDLSANGADNYTWNNGLGAGTSHTVSPSVTTTYTVTGTDANGCINTADVTIEISDGNVEITNDANICEGETYTLPGGDVVDQSGTYEMLFESPSGCDSLVTTVLTVNPTYSFSESITLCEGETHTLPGGNIVDATGDYEIELQTTAGCDSIFNVSVTVNPAYDIEINAGICDSQEYDMPDGSTEDTSGTYVFDLQTNAGCDSTITINLSVQETIEVEITAAICDSETYTLPGGDVVNQSGTYENQFDSPSGCDSIVTTVLTVNPSYLFEESISLCEGETYTLPGGTVVDATGDYEIELQTANGCDSTFNISVTVNPVYDIEIDAEICDSQEYDMPDGSAEATAGTYAFDLQTSAGCDSTITVNLTVQENVVIQSAATICDNESYTLPDGTLVSDAGSYDVVLGVGGCDTLHQVEITVIPTFSQTESAAICAGENYTMPDGSAESTAGAYVYNFVSINGCDSTITINLEVLPTYNNTQLARICPGDTYTLADGSSVNQAGVYPQNFSTIAGCDSIVNIDLSFYPEYDLEQVWQVCEGDNTLDPDGNPITGSGEYFLDLTTVNGCDSIVHITVNYGAGSTHTQQISFCRGEQHVTSTGKILTESGVYQDVFTNATGCDSVLIYNVSVLPNPLGAYTTSPPNGSVYNGPIQFFNESIEADSISWDFGEFGITDEENPIINFDGMPGKYPVCLYTWNNYGCSDLDCFSYHIKDDYSIYIPNAFSPNGDGRNDLFFVEGKNIDPDDFLLQIVNRNGEVIFETLDPTEKWDGSTASGKHYAQVELYVYRVVVGWLNTLDKKEYTGNVTVIR